MPSFVVSAEGLMRNSKEAAWKCEFQKFVSKYSDDIPVQHNLYAQMDMWQVKWITFKGTLPTTLPELISATDKNMFPPIYVAIQILATIPVTACSCERSILGLRRMKSWMRNTMTEERLDSISVIMFNRDIKVDVDKVVDEFAAGNKHRMTLMNVLAD